MKLLHNLFQGYFKSDAWGNRRYSECWSDYPGVGKVTDEDVANHALKHLKFFDRFDPKKVIEAGISSQLYLFKVYDEPDKKNWKY